MDHSYDGHHHHHHERRDDDETSPPHRYRKPHDFPQVSHMSHEQANRHHGFIRPNSSGDDEHDDISTKQTFKVFSKAAPDFHLTIKDGEVLLAPSNPSDESQNWFKDEKHSTTVKDEERSPCFSLINKATRQAIKHSIGATHPVQLVLYNPDVLDESVLWTMSKDFGDGYRTIRMVSDIHLNMDAFHGDKKSSGVHDGTTIVLWKWNKLDNQLWKILPHPI